MIYFKLFLAFFQVGLFSFGGGLAALPLIRHQTVEVYGRLSLHEFTDLITISQMTPGPIAINTATFVGTKVAGIPGSVVATVSCILAPCAIVSILAVLYMKYKNLRVMQGILGGLRPAIVAMIASAGAAVLALSVFGEGGAGSVDFVAMGLFAAGLFTLRKWKVNPIFVMLGTGAVGGALNLLIK